MTSQIYIIGAGQLGSRHLQALKSVPQPLQITVIDPSANSLQVAKERYGGISGTNHPINFVHELPEQTQNIDIAIIASNSNVRRTIVEKLLAKNQVQFLILEKLLFQTRNDYEEVAKTLSRSNTKAFVNCTMRMVPFYTNIQPLFQNQKIHFTVTGSAYGLITNAIHYLDYMAFLTGQSEFQLNTDLLQLPLIESKRAGFQEMNGALGVQMKDGSSGYFQCFEQGALPIVVEVAGPKARVICKESEGKAWVSTLEKNWQWEEVPSPILFQSQLTSILVQELLTKETCQLVSIEESSKIHLTLMDGIQNFLQRNKLHFDLFPFT